MSDPGRFGRYRTSSGIEGEFEPGSRGRVLRNLQGIRSKRQMDRAEHDALLAVRKKYLTTITSRTKFTAKLVCRMHRDWLGGLYAWAGQYRTVELAKDGFHWPPARLVSQNMADFEDEVLARATPSRQSDPEQLAIDLARVQADFLLIHPFREGNGRMAR